MFRGDIDAKELIAKSACGIQMSIAAGSDGTSQGGTAAGLVQARQRSVVQSRRGVWNGVF